MSQEAKESIFIHALKKVKYPFSFEKKLKKLWCLKMAQKGLQLKITNGCIDPSPWAMYHVICGNT